MIYRSLSNGRVKCYLVSFKLFSLSRRLLCLFLGLRLGVVLLEDFDAVTVVRCNCLTAPSLHFIHSLMTLLLTISRPGFSGISSAVSGGSKDERNAFTEGLRMGPWVYTCTSGMKRAHTYV